MTELIEKSTLAIALARMSLTEVSDNVIIKNFVMWTTIELKENKDVDFHHRVHSNWQPNDPTQMLTLAKAIMISMAQKVGIQVLKEILLKLEKEGWDDSQDSIN